MTEEVTEAMIEAAQKSLGGHHLYRTTIVQLYLAMRSVSNSPTTNGEEYQQARTAYLDEFVGEWSGKRLIAANAYDAGYSRANLTPRAASDDAVEVLRTTHKLISKFAESGFVDEADGMELFINQGKIAAALKALSTPHDRQRG